MAGRSFISLLVPLVQWTEQMKFLLKSMRSFFRIVLYAWHFCGQLVTSETVASQLTICSPRIRTKCCSTVPVLDSSTPHLLELLRFSNVVNLIVGRSSISFLLSVPQCFVQMTWHLKLSSCFTLPRTYK